MTTEEKIAYIGVISEETDENVISAFLNMAEEIARNKVFPWGVKDDETSEEHAQKVLDRYSNVICEIAVYLLNKRGAEGETVHNENSGDRTYESAGVPISILRKLTPFCGVVQ